MAVQVTRCRGGAHCDSRTTGRTICFDIWTMHPRSNSTGFRLKWDVVRKCHNVAKKRTTTKNSNFSATTQNFCNAIFHRGQSLYFIEVVVFLCGTFFLAAPCMSALCGTELAVYLQMKIVPRKNSNWVRV